MMSVWLAAFSPPSHTSKADALVEISLSSIFHCSGPVVARGDAGKRLVIFNLHTAVMASSRLSADVIRAWGPLWPPGVWEDFSLSRGEKTYHCSSDMINVGCNFFCVCISCEICSRASTEHLSVCVA